MVHRSVQQNNPDIINQSINQAFIAGIMAHKNTHTKTKKKGTHTHTHNYKLLTDTKKVTRPK